MMMKILETVKKNLKEVITYKIQIYQLGNLLEMSNK
jgi:hypothetical protein